MHSPGTDKVTLDAVARFQPELVVLDLVLWGYRGCAMGGSMSREEEVHYMLNATRQVLPNSTVLHLIEWSSKWFEHTERAARVVRVL